MNAISRRSLFGMLPAIAALPLLTKLPQARTFASGGPVAPGIPYIVGERGPELWAYGRVSKGGMLKHWDTADILKFEAKPVFEVEKIS